MTAVYGYDVRVLACQACGAPLQAAIAGGLATCAYCGAVNELRARDDREDRERATASHDASISESERMARLREQRSEDALPEAIVDALAPDDGRLAPERIPAGLALWKSTRAALSARGDFLSAERLFHVTRLLLPLTDHQARRVLLETTIELLPDHRHRHVLRCELAIGAARLGELDAAWAWLQAVEPRPLDLLMDSAVRAARATAAAAAGRANDILAELGDQAGDLPVATWYEERINLLRIHGLELFGQHAMAREQLQAIGNDTSRRRALAQLSPLRLAPAATAHFFHLRAVEATARRVRDARLGRQVLGTALGCLGVGMLVTLLFAVAMETQAVALGVAWTVAVPLGALVATAIAAVLGVGVLRQRNRVCRKLRRAEEELAALRRTPP